MFIHTHGTGPDALRTKRVTFKKCVTLETQGHPTARLDFTIVSKRPHEKARRIPRRRPVEVSLRPLVPEANLSNPPSLRVAVIVPGITWAGAMVPAQRPNVVLFCTGVSALGHIYRCLVCISVERLFTFRCIIMCFFIVMPPFGSSLACSCFLF